MTSTEAPNAPDSFDPFESFDAHDVAEGRIKPAEQPRGLAGARRLGIAQGAERERSAHRESPDDDSRSERRSRSGRGGFGSRRSTGSRPEEERLGARLKGVNFGTASIGTASIGTASSGTASSGTASIGTASSGTAGEPSGSSVGEGEGDSELTYSRTSARGRSKSSSSETHADGTPDRKSSRPTLSLKGRALGYLSRREYSRSELARKLQQHADDPEEIEPLLDVLERENWLSDTRFVESLVHRRSSRVGANRIVGEMKRHSVDRVLIEETSAQLRESELPRAHAVWQKKFGTLPKSAAERAKQARFLAARGFSSGTISKILKGLDEEWLDSESGDA